MTVLQEPQRLTDNLTLRWATADDMEKLAAFNAQIHEEEGEEGMIAAWVRDLMSGRHPTTKPADFTLVEDNDGNVISSLCRIPQTWTYDGIPFPVGRPELVGTLETHRRKGLVRRQMEAIHAKGADAGELMQVITGIPWYYRRFGYEMGIDLGGYRRFVWNRGGNYKEIKPDDELYSYREATVNDIPLLVDLYDRHNAGSLITAVRNEAQWRYELTGYSPEAIFRRDTWLITHKERDEVVGYVRYKLWGKKYLSLYEIGVLAEHSLRAVALYVTRAFKRDVVPQSEQPPATILFEFGRHHPVYEALDPNLERTRKPYAYFVRIPDLPAFLNRVRPVLEDRLAGSVMAGHTGKLRINQYTNHLALAFENGRLTEIGSYEPKSVEDGDAHFPDLQFLQLVCGRRTIADINLAFADCYANDEATVLLNILFPQRPSMPIAQP